jgi:restriction system protein
MREMWAAGIGLLAVGTALFLASAFLAVQREPMLPVIAKSLRIPAPWAIGLGVILCLLSVLLRKFRAAAEQNEAHAYRRKWFPTSTGYRSLFGAFSGLGTLDAPVEYQEVRSSQPARAPESAWSERVFDDIEWRRFEALCESLFAQAGFETRSQSHGADGGVDIWLYSRYAEGPVAVVQCKHWRGQPVGVKHVREFFGVMASHGLKRGTFATSASFTQEALRFARDNGISALDGAALLKLIATRTPQQQQELLDVAYEGSYWRPTCANCGVKLVERVKRGTGEAFWGCINFPSCRTTMAVRAG